MVTTVRGACDGGIVPRVGIREWFSAGLAAVYTRDPRKLNENKKKHRRKQTSAINTTNNDNNNDRKKT